MNKSSLLTRLEKIEEQLKESAPSFTFILDIQTLEPTRIIYSKNKPKLFKRELDETAKAFLLRVSIQTDTDLVSKFNDLDLTFEETGEKMDQAYKRIIEERQSRA